MSNCMYLHSSTGGYVELWKIANRFYLYVERAGCERVEYTYQTEEAATARYNQEVYFMTRQNRIYHRN